MAKFAEIATIAQLVQGRHARERAEVVALDGRTKIVCDVRILMPEDDADIEEAAVAFAVAHKVKEPRPGNTQYERGLMLHTLLRGCVDYEVTNRDEPYFASVEEIGKYLDDGRALMLFWQQRAFQKRVSPNPSSGDPAEYIRLLYESIAERAKGGDSALPFVGLPYGTLLNFAVESARLLSSPLLLRSESGSSSQDGSENSESSAKASEKAGS
jgi:hypothetical protein